MSCTVSPSGFVICIVGGHALFCSFLTLWPKPKILLCLTLTLRNSPSHPWIDYIGGDRDELLCPIRALRKYLSRAEPFRPGIEGLFVSMDLVKKRVSRNTISFWLRSVISMAHSSASEEDCCALRVMAHSSASEEDCRALRVRANEVRKVPWRR